MGGRERSRAQESAEKSKARNVQGEERQRERKKPETAKEREAEERREKGHGPPPNVLREKPWGRKKESRRGQRERRGQKPPRKKKRSKKSAPRGPEAPGGAHAAQPQERGATARDARRGLEAARGATGLRLTKVQKIEVVFRGKQIVKTEPESQWIVTTRPLYHLQQPVLKSSRLQVIHRPGSGNCDRSRLMQYGCAWLPRGGR